MSKKEKKIIQNPSLASLIDQYQDANLLSDIERGLKKESALEVLLKDVEYNPIIKSYRLEDKNLTDLSTAISLNGIINPLLVRKVNGKYQVLTGYKRFYVAKLLNLEKIPVVVRDVDDDLMIYLVLERLKNKHEENILNKANAYQNILQEYQISRNDIAYMTSSSVSQVANSLRLLKLPNEIQEFIYQGKLSFGQARSLIGLKPSLQLDYAERIINKNLSVREVEDLVANYKNNSPYEDDIKKIKKKYKAKTRVTQNIIHLKFDKPDDLKKFLAYITKEE